MLENESSDKRWTEGMKTHDAFKAKLAVHYNELIPTSGAGL